ncbi:hypothetical protein CEXT_107161 [Caerostris extrusa]|uniref:SWIM-type domain-containing protein n=1 Tax=Caerostris extrusa TaxID=172846 RepID=A0AAV4N022_CAEEX|nr:hypothetical protein CEXT_107161 [Caerostris extrusa]
MRSQRDVHRFITLDGQRHIQNELQERRHVISRLCCPCCFREKIPPCRHARVGPGADGAGRARGPGVRRRRSLEAAGWLGAHPLLRQGGQGGDSTAHQERALRGQRIRGKLSDTVC